MASYGKKKRGDSSLAESNEIVDDSNGTIQQSDPNELEEGEDMDFQEHVQVDFEARTPEDSDFHGIKKLLQQLFLKANINTSELTDTLISQNYVGSVIKQPYVAEEEEPDTDSDGELDVYGVTSVINITERQNLESVQQLKKYLIDRCKQCSPHHAEFTSLLQNPNKQLGYIINERFINIPPQIALPAFISLWQEVAKAKKKQMKYEFSEYVMVCKTYQMPVLGQSTGGRGEQGKVYINAEEEYFAREATFSFDYSVQSERDSAMSGQWNDEQEELEPYRTVLVIPHNKLQSIMDTLSSNLTIH